MRTLSHAFQELRAHPWRAVLSGLSLLIGVLAVVAIVTISAITAEVYIAGSEQAHGRQISIAGDIELASPDAAGVSRVLEAAAALRVDGGAVVLHFQSSESAGYGAIADTIYPTPLTQTWSGVHFVAGDVAQQRRLPILSGRWFVQHAGGPVEVVTNRAGVDQFGAVGDGISIAHSRTQSRAVEALIVGVIADGSSEPTLYVPAISYGDRQPSLFERDVRLTLQHASVDQATLTQAGNDIVARSGAQFPEGSALHRSDDIERILADLRTQQNAFLITAVIMLVVSAIGMLNIGLASVAERSRELVVRRALGATRGGILGQVLLASVWIGLLAVAVATFTAVIAVTWWVPQQIPPESAIEPPGVPWLAVLWGGVAGVGTTLVGGALPAVVAARLDMAAALRD